MGNNCCQLKGDQDNSTAMNVVDETPCHLMTKEQINLANNLPAAQYVHLFKTKLSLSRGNIRPKLQCSITCPDSQALATIEPKKNISHLEAIPEQRNSSKYLSIDNVQSSEGKEEIKTPESCRSQDVYNRAPSLKFQLTPMCFRSEKKSIEDRYQILEMIGKGAFGEIRKIRDRFTKEIKVLKTLHKSQCQDAKEFSEEIKILQRLDHPNVVRFFEYYQDETFYYLVTE